MRRFKRISLIIIAVQIILIIISNLLLIRSISSDESKLYKVECARIIRDINDNKDIDLSNYKTILSVHEYDPSVIINNDYKITLKGDTYYQIEYKTSKDYSAVLYLDIAFLLMLIITGTILIYVDKKILKPFDIMSNVSVELAKGNLSAAVKEDRNKFYGRFVWGINMLRDNLQNNREKELSLQKEKKTLILSLSHDIKTPLSAIKLYTKALMNDLYDTREKRDEALTGITKNTEEIERYVSEIVTASREDFLNLEAINGEYYLSEIIKKIEAYYKDKLQVNHTEFIIEKYDECLIYCDKDRLIEVMQNVMENAIKYGDGKYIKISFDEEEDYKLITFKNSGTSVKDEELAHLFESFYRGSNADGIKGSGLGLYIAKTLMRLMKGDIYAKNDGDDFELTLVIKLL